MDQFLSQNLNLLIFLLFGGMLILMAILVTIVIYLLLKDRKPSAAIVENKESTKGNKSKELEQLKKQQSSVYCLNHEKEPSVGTCAICEEAFCEECLKEYEHLRFCPEHFKTYTENSWVDITNVRTTPTETENAIPIYQLKKEVWEKENIPTYIETNYKINVEGDFVESYVKLFVREEDRKDISSRLNSLKVH